MKRIILGVIAFFIASSIFAQADLGRYREILINNDFRIYILRSQRCANIDDAWDFWYDNAFLWNTRWIINNQQERSDFPDAEWKQASDSMFQWAWSNQHHFENGMAYIFRTVNIVDNSWRIISQRVIYFAPDGNTVWYYYNLNSVFEPY